ncbi:MAG: ABC transporter permease, partial [Candidatus Eremiobacteraeota bacterium]|nr:ABC transporter permease [Candidatus Eremiobacteraeota bacterium]
MSRWRFLSLERPRIGSRFRLRDRVLCSLGLALGVFFLILAWGFISPVEELIRTKILGTLPDRIQVAKSSVSLGPLAFGGSIEEKSIEEVRQIPGVVHVLCQAHFPDPCQLHAQYAGEGLVTDLVLEMVDPGQVEPEIASGYKFEDPGPGEPIPAVVPRAILDLVNSGISVNTSLPQLTEKAILGKGFDLYVGTSSFRRGSYTKVRCTIVGVSDQIGAGGPAIPYESGVRLAKESPIIHSLVLQLADPAQTQAVSRRIDSLGLRAPRQELASRVTSVAAILKLFAALLPLAVLSVTSIALGAVLELQVSKERQLIALYRAVGATRHQITQLYLARAFSVALISIVVGVGGAMLGGHTLAYTLEQKIPADLLQGQTLFAPPLSSIVLA